MKTILVADENNRIRNLVRLMFTEHMGYRVVDTSSGTDAVLRAKSIKPDIVLADVSLPDKNGYEVSRKIKKDPLLKGTPVLLLVDQSEVSSQTTEGAQVYADDIIEKPFEPGEVIRKVKSVSIKQDKYELKSSTDPNVVRKYRLKLFMRPKKKKKTTFANVTAVLIIFILGAILYKAFDFNLLKPESEQIASIEREKRSEIISKIKQEYVKNPALTIKKVVYTSRSDRIEKPIFH